MALTKEQIAMLITIERTTGTVSAVSILIIIAAYSFLKRFRTHSNKLLLFASASNIFANVAALIGGSALKNPNGAFCQFQGFLLEMFMQSDPMWSLAMAVNVYLVFFKRYQTSELNRLIKWYALICYGLPFIFAMACLFLHTKNKGKVYGNATLWCWIDNAWAPLRLETYYGFVWLCIACIVVIYVLVGYKIFMNSKRLKAAQNYGPSNSNSGTGSANLERTISQTGRFTGTRPTDIETATNDQQYRPKAASPTTPATAHTRAGGEKGKYSITIDATGPTNSRSTIIRRPSSSADKVKRAYAKAAFLFALSIFVTWIPASINRGLGLRYPNNPSLFWNAFSALVLPLQGFWNMLIFFVTSQRQCKATWTDWKATWRQREDNGAFRSMAIVRPGARREAPAGKETDSMVELSTTRESASRGGDSFST